MKCQFCGSEQITTESPYVELNNMGEYVPKLTYCCKAQKQNKTYSKNHLDALTREEIYTDEEIAKE